MITASLLYTTYAMIQAVGKVHVPIINMAIGTVVRIALVYVLCGIPEINVNGAAFSTFVSYFVMIVLNVISIHRILPGIPSVLGMAVRSMLAALILAGVSYLIYICLLYTSRCV